MSYRHKILHSRNRPEDLGAGAEAAWGGCSRAARGCRVERHGNRRPTTTGPSAPAPSWRLSGGARGGACPRPRGSRAFGLRFRCGTKPPKRRSDLGPAALPSHGARLRHRAVGTPSHQASNQAPPKHPGRSGSALPPRSTSNQPTPHDPRPRRRAGLGRSRTAGRRGRLPAVSERAGASRPARTQPRQAGERQAAQRARPSRRPGSHPLPG